MCAAVQGNKRVRILHVVGGMNRCGVETWLMHVLRHIDRDRFRMDFLVPTTDPCAYDEEIRSLGSHIIQCPHPGLSWRFGRNLMRSSPGAWALRCGSQPRSSLQWICTSLGTSCWGSTSHCAQPQ